MYMTGFYSKDFILESAFGQFYFSGQVVYFIATIAAMFTTLYSVKVLYLTYLTNPLGPLVNYKHALCEGDIFMTIPLIILAFFSILFGYITKDIFIGLGSGLFADNSIFIHPIHEIMLDTEFAVPTLFKLLPLIFTISLTIISIVLSEFGLLLTILLMFKLSRSGYNIFGFFNQRFLIEMYYNKYITNLVLKLGGQTTKVVDKGSVELAGPHGLEKSLPSLSGSIASLNRGVITSYALYILIGLIIYIFIPYISSIDNSLLVLLLLCNQKSLSSNNSNTLLSSNYQEQSDDCLRVCPAKQAGLVRSLASIFRNMHSSDYVLMAICLTSICLLILWAFGETPTDSNSYGTEMSGWLDMDGTYINEYGVMTGWTRGDSIGSTPLDDIYATHAFEGCPCCTRFLVIDFKFPCILRSEGCPCFVITEGTACPCCEIRGRV